MSIQMHVDGNTGWNYAHVHGSCQFKEMLFSTIQEAERSQEINFSASAVQYLTGMKERRLIA